MQAYAETTSWNEIKAQVRTLNNDLYEIIEEINPQNLPLKIAYYPYGATISDAKHFYFPTKNGTLEPLTEDIFSYVFILDKYLEVFLNTSSKIIPWKVYEPGLMTPYNFEIPFKPGFQSRPNSVFTLTSGIRNLTMLPMYQESEAFRGLAQHYKLRPSLSPLNPANHHAILADIANKEQIDWHSSLLIFGREWKENVLENKNWLPLKVYLLENSIRLNSFRRNMFALDHAMNEIQRKYNINHRSYTQEMIKQIILIAVGDMPGLKPAIDDSGLPTEELTQAFNTYFKPITTPMIMASGMNTHNNPKPLYHSLCTTNDALNDKKTFRPLKHLNEIASSLPIYLKALSEHMLTKDIIYGQLETRMKNQFYSERGDDSGLISESTQLINNDDRIAHLYSKFEGERLYGFPKRSIFAKAVTSISML